MIIITIGCYLCCWMVVYGWNVIVHAHQQRCLFNCSDDEYPLQLIPMSTQDVLQYTMWTPQNWTMQSIHNNNNNYHQSNCKQQQPPPPPTLNYNAYLVTSTSPRANFFQIITPSIMYQSNKLNTIRIDTNDGIKKKMFFRSHTRNFYTRFSSIIQNNNLLQRTSEQSLYHHCTYAMNGGPFHSDGSSVGVVVVQKNGTQHILSNDFGPNVGIGIAKTDVSNDKTDTTMSSSSSFSPSSFWVIGRLDNESQIRSLNIQQFVTGFDWLVYNYTNIPQQQQLNHYTSTTTTSTFDPTLRASRSTIGITSDGKLLLLVTDGCEHCLRHKGLTLIEVADILIYLGVQYAINLDGGSSSVLVHESSTILNHPMCYYNAIIPRKWYPCERSVATVICIT